ncbi:MAG TPA: transglutaminaseTgpA domain-containing protein [Candidatus Dormibacteraeota bacterium]|nr:transglutaminaseTgpA domain-containing protein [Candidatus Dormibacteraeota bacterium]
MAALRLRLPASPIEESAPARAFALAGFAVACLGVAIYGQDYVVPAVGLAVTAVGHWVSYRGRAKTRTFWGQALVAGLVIACMAYFLADSAGALFGGEMPQANFAVLLVAVTSFDLKTRRNCYSSLWISLAILYLAAVYAWDYLFAALAAAWIACLLGFWVASHLRRIGAGLRLPAGAAAVALLGALAIGSLAFVFVPQPQGLPNGPLVVSLPSFTQFKGEIENPALPLVQVDGGVNTVDLRYRGRLGDAPVMYVRTGAPAYWRGLVFDTYRDGVWTASQSGPYAVFPAYIPARLMPQAPSNNLGTFVQTFRLLRDMPPVVDAAYPIESLYVPVGQLARDPYGTFHTPNVLRAGTTYSVVSYIPDLSSGKLQSDAFPRFAADDPDWREYLDTTGLSAPAAALGLQYARSQAGGSSNEYLMVMGVVQSLQHNYRYSLQVGHAQPGVDPVEQFLFRDHFGYCEQFATTAVLMLRSLGIPARLVTGYATGDYDPVLNQAIVREKDAHAWVEAWFPGDGWVPVDPTPSFSGLPATQFPDRWAASGIARLIPHLTIGAAPVVLGSLGALGVVPPAVAIAFVVVLVYAWLRRRQIRRRRRAAEPPGSSDLLDLYERLQRRAGRRRASPETPLEYWTVMHDEPLLEEVTLAVNEGAYAGRWPDRERVRELTKKLS